MYRINVFGTPSFRGPDRQLAVLDLPRGKPGELMEIIALARGRVVSKTALVGHLWAGDPPRHAVATLETYIAVLRRSLQPGVPGRETFIRTAVGGYRMDRSEVCLDLDDFDATVSAAKRACPQEAVSLWQVAAELARLDVLQQRPDAEWVQAVRSDYACRGVQAAVCGARAALDAGRIDIAEQLAEQAVERDPLVEDGWQALIEALGRAGRPADAARAAAACLETLARELGVHPSPLTRRLLRVALAGSAVPAYRPLAAVAR